MATVVTRLLVIAALMLMPFGMTHADAMPNSHETSRSPAHCAEAIDQAEDDTDRQGGVTDCKGMCSAVPMRGEGVTQSIFLKAPLLIGTMIPFVGIEPGITTPPPKVG